MAKRRDSITALLKRCDTDLKKIEQEYRDSLDRKQVRTDLQVDIKNLCENLRSILDYIAHDIRETHSAGADPRARFYFPILASKASFESSAKKWYPGLDVKVPDLWGYLESVQPYHSDWSWIGVFNRLTNANKHSNLIAQKRTETPEVRASSRNIVVNWKPENVTFGPGVSIANVPIDPRTQMPVPDPSLKLERITWVDFRFESENVSALGLLKKALAGVGKIAADVEKWL